MFRVLLLVTTLVISCNTYKVLVVFPMPSKSHSILGDGVVRALAKANHEVTYITPFPTGKQPKNVREIDVSPNKELYPENISNIKTVMENNNQMGNISHIAAAFSDINAKTLEYDEVQKMLYDPNVHFDVVILEWMYHELHSGLSVVFNCPFIWVSLTDPHWKILQLVDETPSPAYSPDAVSGSIPPFTFFERFKELHFQVAGIVMSYILVDPPQFSNYDRLLVPAMRRRGREIPSFDEVRYNASLVLSNSHVSYGKATKLPQNFKPIGGYHIDRDLKPLPQNLQKIMDNAKHGVIYFSMGSNLKSKYMPEDLKQNLLKMFGGLKYDVIWNSS